MNNHDDNNYTINLDILFSELSEVHIKKLINNFPF